MSRITAPEGEVTTPITSGSFGSGRLRDWSNRPSAASIARRRSSCAIRAPTPAGRMSSITIWYLDWPGKVVRRPVAITSSPSSGSAERRAAAPFQITPESTARSSLRSR